MLFKRSDWIKAELFEDCSEKGELKSGSRLNMQLAPRCGIWKQSAFWVKDVVQRNAESRVVAI